jgi:hypothetical protein
VAGVVTVCEKSARILRVVDKNLDKFSRLSACADRLADSVIAMTKTYR